MRRESGAEAAKRHFEALRKLLDRIDAEEQERAHAADEG
jgi:hypothetical protein